MNKFIENTVSLKHELYWHDPYGLPETFIRTKEGDEVEVLSALMVEFPDGEFFSSHFSYLYMRRNNIRNTLRLLSRNAIILILFLVIIASFQKTLFTIIEPELIDLRNFLFDKNNLIKSLTKQTIFSITILLVIFILVNTFLFLNTLNLLMFLFKAFPLLLFNQIYYYRKFRKVLNGNLR